MTVSNTADRYPNKEIWTEPEILQEEENCSHAFLSPQTINNMVREIRKKIVSLKQY
jgi:hypothetical protein